MSVAVEFASVLDVSDVVGSLVLWTVRFSWSKENVLLRLSLDMKRGLLVGVTGNNNIVGQLGDSQR